MQRKTVLFVLVPEFGDWEAALPAVGLHWGFFLWEAAYEVKTVALREGPVRSLGGFTILPDHTVDTAPEDFAGLILIGSTGWRDEEAKKVLPLLRKAKAENRVIGAICDAARFLAVHGFVDDVEHTANALSEITGTPGAAYAGAARYKERQSVRDGKIITANGTGHAEFARDVLLALHAAEPGKIAEFYRLVKKGHHPE